MSDRRVSDKQIEASDPRASAWVAANAGSGKTHVLVNRVVRQMLAGMEPARILCITFTKAAAAEMAGRLFEQLGGWIALDDSELAAELAKLGADNSPDTLRLARRLFTKAQETPGGLKIQTIHAFCERLLQLFPVEAGVVPGFAVMDDRAAREALNAARDSIINRAEAEPMGELAQALGEVVCHVQAEAFSGLLGEILDKRADLHDVLASRPGIDMALAILRDALGLASGEDKETVIAGLALDIAHCDRLAAALSGGSAAERKRGLVLGAKLRSGCTTLLDLRDFLLTKKSEPFELSSIVNKSTCASNLWIEGFIIDCQQKLLAGIARFADLERLAATRALLVLAGEIATEFERIKRQAGSYDFDDLIARTRSLLAARPDASWVLFKLDGGIDHVLIDEAQDTSPAQWEIVRALTTEFFAGHGAREGDKRTLFAVGDRKQSIYSFQGADPDVFEIVREELERRIRAAGHDFRNVDFTVSFRSIPQILKAVDIVFDDKAVARSGLEDKRKSVLVHEASRRESGLVDLWPLIVPEEPEEDLPWTAPVDREPANSPRRRLARKIANTAKSWIGKRLIEATGKPVGAGDILILVRTRNGLFDALVRELRNAGVPVAGADRLRLTKNLAVLDLLALARFCLLPEDDYSLACLLKSPLVPVLLDEDQLFALAWKRGPRSLWQRLGQSTDPASIAAHARLQEWRRLPDRRPYEFFASILIHSRKRILARLGSEAGDALDAFLDSALDYERDHGSSLAGFISWFVAGEDEIKRNMEEESGEVRVMTVHGAKGLESPIVILPDTCDVPDARQQSALMMVEARHGFAKLPFWRLSKRLDSPRVGEWKSKAAVEQTHEYYRLLYVAMTRARDELHICGCHGVRKPPENCWYRLIEVMKPAMRQLTGNEGAVAGWRLGGDPQSNCGRPEPAGIANSLPDWIITKPLPVEKEPWLAPSRLGGVKRHSDEARRLAKRGILLHRLLQHLPDMPATSREDFARRAMRREGLDETLWLDLHALLAAPELAALFASGGLAEVPVIARIESLGRTISGRIDRLLVTEDEVMILDYKTGPDWPKEAAEADSGHIVQLAAYREAIRSIYPGHKVRAALLWTAAPKLIEIPGALLDKAIAWS